MRTVLIGICHGLGGLGLGGGRILGGGGSLDPSRDRIPRRRGLGRLLFGRRCALYGIARETWSDMSATGRFCVVGLRFGDPGVSRWCHISISTQLAIIGGRETAARPGLEVIVLRVVRIGFFKWKGFR